MKKTLFALAAIAAIFASCTKEESLLTPSVKKGAAVTFIGETFPESKTVIGELSDGKYPVLWAKNDKIGIISPADTIFKNASATLYGEGGSSKGTFTLDQDIIVPQDVDVLIYYPRDSYTAIAESVDADLKTHYALASNVSMEQIQAKPNDNSHTGKYALAWAKTTVKATEEKGEELYQEPVKFSLSHAVSYVKLVVSSSKYSSYKLAGASIWADGAALTGDIKIDIENGSINTTYPREYAVVTVADPQPLTSAQELWLVTLPCDLTGKDVYVSVSMTDGSKNVTIPVKIAGGKLPSNAVTTISVSAEENTISWYEPEETRYLAEGWAYGPANCVMVTDPATPITMDVKARGYFMGCREPKYVWVSNLNYGSTAFKLSINGKAMTAKAAATAASADNCAVVENGMITLDFTGSNTSSVVMAAKIILADANFKTLWAYTLWPAWAYKDGVIAATYKCGKVVMDRNIGEGTDPSYAQWHGMGCYFQWGRPFCFGWSGGGSYIVETTSAYSLKQNAENAEKFLKTDGSSNNMSDWWLGNWTRKRSDRKDDFWGNANTDNSVDGSSVAGTKSIFDPCPKGWMVTSPDVLAEVAQLGDSQLMLFPTESSGTANGEWGKYIRAIKYKWGTKDEDFHYYKFDGLKWGSNGGNPTNQVNDILCYYSNSSLHGSNSSDHYVYSLYYRSKEGEFKFGGSRNSGCSVRCMKDVDNR